MYLLSRDDHGQLELAEFDPNTAPRYAILSHTWDLDEISFDDVRKNKYRDKKDGYRKIDFCLTQAAADGLRYCWVDTCCIDKTNSAELSEAINSMFRWYANSDRCYVYLSDVPEKSFQSSRWFTRGWTLQELLAPAIVDFFSSQGRKLGDKRSLMQDIHTRTLVPIAALQGEPLSEFGVEERMSWAAQRQTKREEDMVYSLLGIFRIFMPLIYGEGRENAESRLRKHIEESQNSKVTAVETTATTSAATAAERAVTLPFALPGAPIITSFTGRADEIAQIRLVLPSDGTRQTVILHGLGGMGKTQLAIEYAKTRRNYYTAVLWMDGRDEASLQQSFAGVASRLSRAYPSLSAFKLAAESASSADAVDAVLSWLDDEGNSRWLLIIDNVDAPHIPGVVEGLYDVQRYLPTTWHGHVLITTRSSQLTIGRQIKLQKIRDANECLKMFVASAQRPELEHDSNALELVNRLDGLPLALSAAGAYLNQMAVSPAEYLQYYENSWLELQQKVPSLQEHQGRTLHTTWEISRRQVESRSPSAHRLLRLWAFFAKQDVWYELLQAGRRHFHHASHTMPEWFMDITESKLSFDHHMRVLCDYGLVESQQEPAGYGMHECVHDWVREVLGKDNRTEEADIALRCIANANPSTRVPEYWVAQRRLLSHVDSYMRQPEAQGQNDKRFEQLHRLGRLYKRQSRFEDAEKMFARALKGSEKAMGREHEMTLYVLNSFGNNCLKQDKLKEAEDMYIRALEAAEKVLGPEHKLTLDTLNNLGMLYEKEGKLSKSEAMYGRALAGTEKTRGPDHTSTLDTVHNMGNLYWWQGRLPESEQMLMRALVGEEKALGPEHVSTLETVHSIGFLYEKQGKLIEAAAMFERALNGYMKTLGPDHALTQQADNNLKQVRDKVSLEGPTELKTHPELAKMRAKSRSPVKDTDRTPTKRRSLISVALSRLMRGAFKGKINPE